MSLIKRVSRFIGGHEYTVELRHCRSCEHHAALVYQDGELLARGHTLGHELDSVMQSALSPAVFDRLNARLAEDAN